MVIGYIVFINALSVIVCIKDKKNAEKGKWRISEKTLFLLSFSGGAVGMYITMKTIRHKTRHKRFMIGLPIIISAQILGLILILYLTFRLDWFNMLV